MRGGKKSGVFIHHFPVNEETHISRRKWQDQVNLERSETWSLSRADLLNVSEGITWTHWGQDLKQITSISSDSELTWKHLKSLFTIARRFWHSWGIFPPGCVLGPPSSSKRGLTRCEFMTFTALSKFQWKHLQIGKIENYSLCEQKKKKKKIKV